MSFSVPPEDFLQSGKPLFSFSTIVAPNFVPSVVETSPTIEDKIFSPSKEILPLYFCYLERFQFGEAAKVLSLAARTMNKVWALFPPLQLLSACEAIYHSLIFLEVMSNNEYLETMYSEVVGAIIVVLEKWTTRRGSESKKVRPNNSTAHHDRSELATIYFCDLLKELVIYVECRKQLVELRHKMHKSVFDATPAVLKACLTKLNDILKDINNISHQLLVQVAQNMETEVEMFRKLIQAELSIAQYKSNEALFYFHLVDVEIQSWKSKFVFVKDKVESSAFLDTSIYRWCVAFRNHLYAKMKLFFQDFMRATILAPNNDQDPFMQEAGAELHLHERIVEFTAQSNCFNVSLVLQPPPKQAMGKSSWTAIYTFPQKEAPVEHWPNIISLYQDNSTMIDTAPQVKIESAIPLMDRIRPEDIPLNILHYYDTGVETTYYLAKLQSKVLLVIIFKGEREEDDAQVISFIKGLYARLRYSQLLQNVLAKASSNVNAKSSSPAPSPELSPASNPELPPTSNPDLPSTSNPELAPTSTSELSQLSSSQ